jgi:hypothetical protein
MNNIDTNSSNIEENEIEDYSQNGNSNSVFSDNKSNEISYINEFYNGINKPNIIYNFWNKKQRNIIDYLNINDDEYKKQQCFKKINFMLKGLNSLPNDIINEIVYYSWYYFKKLSNKKLSTIVPIITYKIIKKYDIKSVSLKDLKQNLNFCYKTYFQNEKLFNELNSSAKNKENNFKFNNNINNIIISKKQSFSELVLGSITKYIDLAKDKIQIQPNIIKFRNNKKRKDNNYDNEKLNKVKSDYKIIESLFSKISKNENNAKELYSNPAILELNNCLMQCKSLIYNNKQVCIEKDELTSETNMTNQTINLIEDNDKKLYDENTFNKYFENKIDSDNLGLGLLKYFVDKNKNISLSYKKMQKLFNCSIYQIKKSILYINEYINYINKIE